MSASDDLTRIRAIHAAAREAMTDEERQAEDEHVRELLWDDARLAAADAEADR